MASEQEDLPPDVESYPEEDGGGPVKTFLEHLEDLRWMLIKCVAAVLVAMLVCLIGGSFLVKILTWPLNQAQKFTLSTDRRVTLHIGTNVIGKCALGELGNVSWRTNPPSASNPAPPAVEFVLGGMSWGTNTPSSVSVVPVPVGTNLVLTLRPDAVPWQPESHGIVTLVNLGPLGGILVAMKLALFGGLVLAAPFLIFFIGQFVLPALKLHEKKLLYQIVSFGSVLFFMGVAFCYFLVMAVALSAAVQFSQWLGFSADQWRAEEYISFMCKFMLAMGLSFELPVVLLTIVKIGLLDYVKLRKFRPYWIVISLIISAFITPSGDPVTMFLMAIPLWILYEISVLVALYWHRRDRKREEAERRREEAGRRTGGEAMPRK